MLRNKNAILCIIDKIVWWFIALFPLIILLFSAVNHNIVSIGSILNTLGLDVTTNNVIYTGLIDIFGSTGNFLQLFNNTDVIAYATYFITINLVHLVIDLMLFMVDICHNWLKGGFRKW